MKLSDISPATFNERAEECMKKYGNVPMANIAAQGEMLNEIHLMLRTLVFGFHEGPQDGPEATQEGLEEKAEGKGSMAPQGPVNGRLYMPEVTERTGLDRTKIRALRKEQAFPEPDGRDGLSYWWHDKTITAYCRNVRMSVD